MTTRDDRDELTKPNDYDALREVRERAREAKRRCRQELIQHQRLSDKTKVHTAEVALDYRDLLIDYRPDLGEEKWESRDVDWIEQLVGETVETKEEAPGLGRGTQTAEKPAFVNVDGFALYRLLKHLDQIWRALGLGAETSDDDLPVYEIGAQDE